MEVCLVALTAGPWDQAAITGQVQKAACGSQHRNIFPLLHRNVIKFEEELHFAES